MGDAKPWQIALIVVGLLGFIGMLAWTLTSQDRIEAASTQTWVDVRTGELVISELRTDRSLGVPAKNPPSTERTLYPIYQDQSQWKVEQGFLSAIASLKPPSEFVDTRTGVVKSTGSPVKKDLYPR